VAGDRAHPFRVPTSRASGEQRGKVQAHTFTVSSILIIRNVQPHAVCVQKGGRGFVQTQELRESSTWSYSERLNLNPLFYRSFAPDHLTGPPSLLEMHDFTRGLANVPRSTSRTGTIQGPERHDGGDDRHVSRRGVGVLHRGRETR
jgi:hypothetical protein